MKGNVSGMGILVTGRPRSSQIEVSNILAGWFMVVYLPAASTVLRGLVVNLSG